MKLAPTGPPGRITRKARAFASEILQLRAQGYTFEAIREALAGAGVHVSNSTVQREVARAAGRPPTVPPVDAAASHRGTRPRQSTGGAPTHTPATSAAPAVPYDEDAPMLVRGLGGKETAEAFFSAHHSNPLLSTKETS